MAYKFDVNGYVIGWPVGVKVHILHREGGQRMFPNEPFDIGVITSMLPSSRFPFEIELPDGSRSVFPECGIAEADGIMDGSKWMMGIERALAGIDHNTKEDTKL